MTSPGGLLTLASTLAVGGGERVLATLLKGLQGHGVKQRILFLKEPGEIGEELRAAGIPVRSLACRDTRDPRIIVKLISELRRHAPDLLYIQDHHDCLFHGRIAAALAGWLPALSPVHSSAQGKLRAFRLYNRILLGLSPNLVTLGTWQKRALRLRERVPQGLWVTIPNPVPGPEFTMSEQPVKPGTKLKLVTVAAMRPEKRLDRMLEMVAILAERHELTLTLIGDGPERPALEARCKKLGLTDKVIFLGRRDDIAILLAEQDLFLLSSAEEALPVSVLEALMVGLPVAAPPHGAIPELLANGDRGLLFAGHDPRHWAEQLHSRLDDLPSEAERHRWSGILSEEHSPERFTTRYLRTLRFLGLG